MAVEEHRSVQHKQTQENTKAVRTHLPYASKHNFSEAVMSAPLMLGANMLKLSDYDLEPPLRHGLFTCSYIVVVLLTMVTRLRRRTAPRLRIVATRNAPQSVRTSCGLGLTQSDA